MDDQSLQPPADEIERTRRGQLMTARNGDGDVCENCECSGPWK